MDVLARGVRCPARYSNTALQQWGGACWDSGLLGVTLDASSLAFACRAFWGRGLIEAFKHRIVAPQRDAVSNDIVLVLKEMLQAIHTDKSLKQVQQCVPSFLYSAPCPARVFCRGLK